MLGDPETVRTHRIGGSRFPPATGSCYNTRVPIMELLSLMGAEPDPTHELFPIS